MLCLSFCTYLVYLINWQSVPCVRFGRPGAACLFYSFERVFWDFKLCRWRRSSRKTCGLILWSTSTMSVLLPTFILNLFIWSLPCCLHLSWKSFYLVLTFSFQEVEDEFEGDEDDDDVSLLSCLHCVFLPLKQKALIPWQTWLMYSWA